MYKYIALIKCHKMVHDNQQSPADFLFCFCFSARRNEPQMCMILQCVCFRVREYVRLFFMSLIYVLTIFLMLTLADFFFFFGTVLNWSEAGLTSTQTVTEEQHYPKSQAPDNLPTDSPAELSLALIKSNELLATDVLQRGHCQDSHHNTPIILFGNSSDFETVQVRTPLWCFTHFLSIREGLEINAMKWKQQKSNYL